ncbi:MAG TPA: DUF3570 domain-containing protein [Polyangiales bacterium]
MARLGAALLACTLLPLFACGSSSGVRTADTSLYVRSDTDSTTVINPRAHVSARFADKVGLDATYAMDSWTGASIDVVTAATGAIHELRHEVNGAISGEASHVRVGANYRYSTENDYWSHGGVINMDIDMAEKNTTLSLAVLGSLDTVGREGWDTFRKDQDSIGGRLSLIQVLDTKTLLQLSADFVRLAGFQSSPYRYVGYNGQGLCREAAQGCIMEIHPRERMRTSVAARVRRALGSVVSMGLDYRYYFDDWGLDSHTVTPDFSFLIGEHGTLSADYRFYWQSNADFYRPSYPGPLASYQYLTRDRKLSSMMQHHAGLEYRHEVPMGQSGSTVLQLGARGGYTLILYSEFIGLSRVDVVEATALLGLLFR